MNFYKVLLNCFEEYRCCCMGYLQSLVHFVFVCVTVEMSSDMRVVCAEHTDGAQCPACAKVWTKYCMCAY